MHYIDPLGEKSNIKEEISKLIMNAISQADSNTENWKHERHVQLRCGHMSGFRGYFKKVIHNYLYKLVSICIY